MPLHSVRVDRFSGSGRNIVRRHRWDFPLMVSATAGNQIPFATTIAQIVPSRVPKGHAGPTCLRLTGCATQCQRPTPMPAPGALGCDGAALTRDRLATCQRYRPAVVPSRSCAAHRMGSSDQAKARKAFAVPSSAASVIVIVNPILRTRLQGSAGDRAVPCITDVRKTPAGVRLSVL